MAQKSEIEIVNQDAISIDAEEILELRRVCFSEVAGTASDSAEFWRWKHLGESRSLPSKYLVARDSSSKKIVGFYAGSELSYRTPAGAVRVGLVCDVMTSPHFQGQGIFTKLGRQATQDFLKDGWESLTGYPIRENVLPGHRRVGWDFSERLPVFLAPPQVNYWRLLELPMRRRGFTGAACNASVVFLDQGFVNFYNLWVSKALEAQTSFMDLSFDFMKWRYRAPGIEYLASIVRNVDDEIVGFAIARRLKIGRWHYLALGDIRTLEPSIVPLLIKQLRVQTKFVIGVVGMFSEEASASLELKRNGFFLTFKKFWLIQFSQRMLSTPLDSESMLPKPYLTWSDTDDI